MKKRILLLSAIGLFNLSIYAQVNNSNNGSELNTNELALVELNKKQEINVQGAQELTLENNFLNPNESNSTSKKKWKDLSLGAKIATIAVAAVIVTFAVIAPNGYNSRTGV